MSLSDPRHSAADLDISLAPLALSERLAAARALLAGPIVFTTSFGLEDQAITHAIFTSDLDIDIVSLDTGRLFPETYQVWSETEAKYAKRIKAYAPKGDLLERLVSDQGIFGFRHSIEARKTCCEVRKVEPLGRALAGAAGWITGLRAEQSQNRQNTAFCSFDPAYALIKVNPLADWTAKDLARYISDHAVPYNSLHDQGFPSIGCAPCTRAVRIGEPERAGRWWWENDAKKECGLHLRSAHALSTSTVQQQETQEVV
jgi:phosphoadenosine phosphosulfate reductase